MNFIINFLNFCMIVAFIVSPLIIAIICITEHFNRKYDPSQYYRYCNLLEHKVARSSGSLSVEQFFESKAETARKREQIIAIIMLLTLAVSAIVGSMFLVSKTAIGDWIFSLGGRGVVSLLLILGALLLLIFLAFLVSGFICIFVFCGVILVKNKIRGGVRHFAFMAKIKRYNDKTAK